MRNIYTNTQQLVNTALEKACVDPFDYALELTNGTIIQFTEATMLSGEWVRLTGIKNLRLGFTFERGIDVRISEIVWVADAPFGS